MNQMKRAFQSQGLRQSVLVMGGNTFAQGFSAVALILLSRILGPTLYGEFTVGFSLVLILSRINDLGLTYAMARFIPTIKDKAEQNRIFSLAVQAKLMVAVLIMLLGILVTPYLSARMGFENVTILYLSFVLSAVTVAYEQLAGMLQALHRFGQSVAANVIQASGKLVGTLTLGLAGLTSSTMAFGVYMAAPILTLVAAPWLLPRWLKLKLAKTYSTEARIMRRMAGHSALAFIAAGIIENIDILMVQGFLDEYDTGLFGGVARLTLMITMLAFSLAQVLNPRVARYGEKRHMDAFLKKAMYLIAASLVGFLVTFPFSAVIIRFSIGSEYLPALSTMPMLLAASFITIAAVPLVATFFAFPKAEWYFSVSGLLQLVAIVGLNAWLVPVYGIEGAAWARLGTRVVLFGFTAVLVGYFYRKTYLTGVSRQ